MGDYVKGRKSTAKKAPKRRSTSQNVHAKKQLEAIGYTGSTPKAKKAPKSRVFLGWPK